MSLHSFAHWVALESGAVNTCVMWRRNAQIRLFIVIDESSSHTVVDSTVAAH
ncbi:MAG: hypothetical protein ACWA6R_01705 [Nitrosomonas sp.]